MKKTALIAVIVAFATGILAFSTNAAANKYKKMQYQPPAQATGEVASAESNRSMMDCMQFAANFQSQGKAKDTALFNRQFKGAMSEAGNVLTYSYDTYTNIILDCSRGRCFCRCMGK